MEGVCKHFQYGFCKYADRCKYKHISDICAKSPCENVKCTSRHPKKCKYFHIYNTCKFGERCTYDHTLKEDSSREDNLKKIEELENVIESIKTRNNELEERLHALEEGYASQIVTMGAKLKDTKVQTKEDELLCCELCDYKCKHNRTMKKHMNMKHSNEMEICKECQEVFKSAIELLKHIADNHHIEEHNLQENSNVETKTENPEQNITCDNCGKQFSTKSMKAHRETEHCQIKGDGALIREADRILRMLDEFL